MKNTDPLTKFSGHLQSVTTEISKGLGKKGINVVEAIAKLAQPEGAVAIEKIVETMANLMTTYANSEIVSFFQNQSPVKLWLGDNFKNWILTEQPDNFSGSPKTTKIILPKRMTDAEIIKEYKITPYSISEVLKVLYDKISKQPNGENGELLSDGYANLFYVELNDDRLVVVNAYWPSGDGEWGLLAFDLGGGRWDDGSYVFSRS